MGAVRDDVPYVEPDGSAGCAMNDSSMALIDDNTDQEVVTHELIAS